ncbi:MAG TPA: hypothetical protein VFT99_01855, partial [Roseiflexaceae bacterium]|nr:hypothetical protein [Roseiflexaceae bacterium]
HAFTFVKFMRYFLPIYPFLALFAAYGLAWMWRVARAEHMPAALQPWRWLDRQRLLAAASVLTGLVVGGTLLYALAFSSIYSRTHTRVEATRWMFANVPEGSVLANEHWDDWLPIGDLDGRPAYGDNGIYRSVEMPNYEDDTPEKVDRLVENLAQADYVILSSNRLYDSIPRLPMRYPMTIRYYQLLFGGQLGFERIKEFSSYPSLFGIQIPDQSAEEAFSVYDHPRVQIFKKTAAFNAERVRQLLNEGINWDAVVHLSPRQASAAPSVLRLNAAELEQYQQTASWSSMGVGEGSLGSQAPLVAWVLAIELLGVLALPLTLLVFRRMADRGYLFSKALGLLLAGWGAWMLASLRTAPFTGMTIVA